MMKSFFAFLAFVAVAAADVSHIVRDPQADAQVLKQEADVFPDQYRFVYKTSNGIEAQESGALKNVGKDEAAIDASGSYSYTAPNGEVIRTDYIANEFGFQPQGSHLPTPPPPQPIPEYIARALQYIAEHPPAAEPLTKYRN